MFQYLTVDRCQQQLLGFLERFVYIRKTVVISLVIQGGMHIVAVEFIGNSRFDDIEILAVLDRKSTRLNSSHPTTSRMPSSA